MIPCFSFFSFHYQQHQLNASKELKRTLYQFYQEFKKFHTNYTYPIILKSTLKTRYITPYQQRDLLENSSKMRRSDNIPFLKLIFME